MGIHGKSINNDIIIKAVIEVGKFVGVEFTNDQARQFLDCFVAVIGKYLHYNKTRKFHLNKYIISKNNKGKFNLFTVNIYKDDKEIKTADELYSYYLKGGNSIKDFKKVLQEFAERLIEESSEDEETDNSIIEKLSKIRKLTKGQKARKNKSKK